MSPSLERTVREKAARNAFYQLELKASRNVGTSDLRGLRAFADFYGKAHTPMVFYLGDVRRRIAGIDVVPWQEGLREMGL